jgi:hypothetical protein
VRAPRVVRAPRAPAAPAIARADPPLARACASWTLSPPLLSGRRVLCTALLGAAGAKTKDKWGIFKSIDEARSDPAVEPAAGWGAAPGACVSGQDELKDEIALLKGKLASAERSNPAPLWCSASRMRRPALRDVARAVGVRALSLLARRPRRRRSAMAMIKLHPVHATPPLRSMAVEAQRKLEDSRKQTAQLQQQRHSLLQERKAAEEEVANMKLQLREARDALTASHRATKDVMIDYLRALRDAEARAMPHQGTHSEKKKNLKSALPL